MFRRPGHRFVPDILAVSLPGIETSNTPLLSEGAPSAYILERRRTPLYNAGAHRGVSWRFGMMFVTLAEPQSTR